MKKFAILAFVLMLFYAAASAEDMKVPTMVSADVTQEEVYGTYAFKKQFYMNPLSSFLALNGFQEYYEISKDTFLITDQNGNKRSMQASCQQEEFSEAAFQSSFLMEGFGIPDITAFQERRQYIISNISEGTVYRLYFLDDEIWLAQVRKDSTGKLKSEYIWSIYQVERYEGEIPAAVAITGTQDGVEEFLALHGEYNTRYDKDTCYNITPAGMKETAGYSIFKYDASCESYLLYDGIVYLLGIGSGGFGVTSMELCDLNGDGKQELYFTFSFGYGLHRSHVAYFDPVPKQMVPIEYMHVNRELIVAKNGFGGLSLYDAEITSMESFTQFEMKSNGRLADIVYEEGEVSLSPLLQK